MYYFRSREKVDRRFLSSSHIPCQSPKSGPSNELACSLSLLSCHLDVSAIFFGITSFIKKKNNIFESYLFLVVDARFSRNSLANPASCTQLALFFLPLKTTINKENLKLVPASKIMEMFLLSAAPPSLSWRRDRFPSKPLKLPFFSFLSTINSRLPPLDIHRSTT